ncbi:MAG: HIT family protein [Actinomycetota bacterium]|nr:HIT family protein [Actinomycetota bacterium]
MPDAGAAVDGCAFCDIVAGRRPAHRVLDDAVAVAFLDDRPLFAGHTLVVPRAHHETLMDLPADRVGPLFARARRLAGAVEQALGASGSFVALNNRVSQSVPHLHVHVVPRRPKDGLRGFFWPRRPYHSREEAEEVAARLRDALGADGDS